MDDMIYRNDSIAEENIDPNGRCLLYTSDAADEL